MSLDTLIEAARYIEQQELRRRLEEEPAAEAACAGRAPSPRPPPHNVHSTLNTGARAGTREVHNKLEKNRRAHLKECFELLKKQLPAADDKKASNLAILGSANRYIQVLRRKERECEHEMERLAREKIAAQQRLAALKREVSLRAAAAQTQLQPRIDPPVAEASEPRREVDERLNGHVVGIPFSISGGGDSLPGHAHAHALVAPLTIAPHQNGASESVALVHPAHLHLPLSQVVRGGVVVGGAALQLVAGGGNLRVLHHAIHSPLASAGAGSINRSAGVREAGAGAEASIVTAVSTESSGGSVVVTPLVVSQGQAQLLQAHAHALTHKVESGMVSAQYVSGALVKPLVVVSAPAPVPAPAPPAPPHHRS